MARHPAGKTYVSPMMAPKKPWPGSSTAKASQIITHPARLLASGDWPPAPSHALSSALLATRQEQWLVQAARPVTAARPRPNCTDFRLRDGHFFDAKHKRVHHASKKEHRQCVQAVRQTQSKILFFDARYCVADALEGATTGAGKVAEADAPPEAAAEPDAAGAPPVGRPVGVAVACGASTCWPLTTTFL